MAPVTTPPIQRKDLVDGLGKGLRVIASRLPLLQETAQQMRPVI
jgi:hypothetical protein